MSIDTAAAGVPVLIPTFWEIENVAGKRHVLLFSVISLSLAEHSHPLNTRRSFVFPQTVTAQEDETPECRTVPVREYTPVGLPVFIQMPR